MVFVCSCFSFCYLCFSTSFLLIFLSFSLNCLQGGRCPPQSFLSIQKTRKRTAFTRNQNVSFLIGAEKLRAVPALHGCLRLLRLDKVANTLLPFFPAPFVPTIAPQPAPKPKTLHMPGSASLATTTQPPLPKPRELSPTTDSNSTHNQPTFRPNSQEPDKLDKPSKGKAFFSSFKHNKVTHPPMNPFGTLKVGRSS